MIKAKITRIRIRKIIENKLFRGVKKETFSMWKKHMKTKDKYSSSKHMLQTQKIHDSVLKIGKWKAE